MYEITFSLPYSFTAANDSTPSQFVEKFNVSRWFEEEELEGPNRNYTGTLHYVTGTRENLENLLDQIDETREDKVFRGIVWENATVSS